MQPEILELTGFRGINSGLGKQSVRLDLRTIPTEAKLVALTGPNGIGKTTLMDNLHPYRVMPSRSTTLGPGGFSYWDNLSAPFAKKELYWNHNGVRYLKTLIFKASGKTKKAEAYLAQFDPETDSWKPVTLPDGTTSDGKAETYDRCVDAILGSPESYFTSFFSAQRKRQLSDYSAGDIKSLLSSILNLGHYKGLADTANLVAKHLQLKLDDLQADLVKLAAIDELIATNIRSLEEIDAKIAQSINAENVASASVDEKRNALAVLEAKRDSVAKEVEEAVFLQESIEKAIDIANQQIDKIKAQAGTDHKRVMTEKAVVDRSVKDAEATILRDEGEVARLNQLLAKESSIKAALVNIESLKTQFSELDTQESTKRAEVEALKENRAKHTELSTSAATLSTEGHAAKRELDDITSRASLVAEVPCRGHDFQKSCRLLVDAMAAKSAIPGKTVALQDMRSKYLEINSKVAAVALQIQKLDAIEAEIVVIGRSKNDISKQIRKEEETANQLPLVEDAKVRIPTLNANVSTLKEKIVTLKVKQSSMVTEAEGYITAEIAAIAEINTRKDGDVQQLKLRLDKLSKPIPESDVNTAKSSVQAAQSIVGEIQTATQNLRNQKVQVSARIETLKASKADSEGAKQRADAFSVEISRWKLIEKGLGNNGVIALMIDDVGPEISLLCNSLLEECYGGRFHVRLDTQKGSASGVMRETFDVRVSDSHDDEEKSLFIMSGGERIWINECLVRAISLYIDMSNGSSDQTLFTDEADGALDDDKKRQFMKMKRAVLLKGNYKREFYITQTSELWEEADYIIDVSKL